MRAGRTAQCEQAAARIPGVRIHAHLLPYVADPATALSSHLPSLLLQALKGSLLSPQGSNLGRINEVNALDTREQLTTFMGLTVWMRWVGAWGMMFGDLSGIPEVSGCQGAGAFRSEAEGA